MYIYIYTYIYTYIYIYIYIYVYIYIKREKEREGDRQVLTYLGYWKLYRVWYKMWGFDLRFWDIKLRRCKLMFWSLGPVGLGSRARVYSRTSSLLCAAGA